MLRDFLESGGKVEWHALTDSSADATFSHPSGGTVRIDWNMKRAAAAGLGTKDMWRKYPRQMLRARAVSEGIRTVCPMATSGMYVPEEVSDFQKEKDITPTAGAADNVSPERRQVAQELASAMKAHLANGAVDDAVLEAENADLDGADEWTFLWTFFDSKQRSAMKKASAAMKAALAEKETVVTDVEVTETKPVTISDAQRKRLEAMISERGLDRQGIKDYCMMQYSKQHFTELTPSEYDDVCLHIETGATKSAPPQSGQPLPAAGTLPAGGADTTSTAAGQEMACTDTTTGIVEADPAATITPEQALVIESLFDENNIGKLTFFQKARIKKFSDIPASDYQRTVDYVNSVLAKREKILNK
jgi:hypothetical protein